MLQLGRFNTLYALRKATPGMFLGEIDSDEDVLLPNKYVPAGLNPDDSIEVFLYTDSEDRIVATTRTPNILLHQYSVLEVNDVTEFGAFLDWGLEKDLFLPFSGQKKRVEKGDRVTVFLYFDERTERLIASARFKDFIQHEITVKEGEEVDLLVDRKSELGYQVIINNLHLGLLFSSEVFRPLCKGDRVKGFIKGIREDGKIDVSLQKQGYTQIADAQDQLLRKLRDNGGVLHLTDKSAPEEIARKLQMSKKAFKKSVGALYKQRKIKIESDRIVLLI
ncbi:Uncharacterized protein SCG7086_AG_00070 [Chlamydiales bacterium SCGC AG-110-P3]|nr:Uncharacterized protein SCG7086_AG_00070 [Chlamydiales bacterium SCGC AG-110-P3]